MTDQTDDQAQGQEPAAPETETPDAELRRTRQEAQNLRRRLRDAEARAAEVTTAADAAAAAHTAELARQREELTTAIREQTARRVLHTQAADRGLPDPEVAWKLLDRGRIEFDDANEPANLQPLLDELLQQHPVLVGAAGTPRRANPQTPRLTAGFTRDTLRKMSADQINANWDAIQATLTKG